MCGSKYCIIKTSEKFKSYNCVKYEHPTVKNLDYASNKMIIIMLQRNILTKERVKEQGMKLKRVVLG